MHYYEFNIKSYTADTAHFTNDEDLAYGRLIDYYYDTEQPIPTALPPLSRRLRVAMPDLETVLNEFFFLTENGWEHEYCNEKIAKYKAFIAKQKANGIKGGRGNKKPNKPTALPNKANVKPTNNHKPITNNNNKPPLPPLQEVDGLNLESWKRWVDYRKQIKKPIKPVSVPAAQRAMAKFGQDQEAVVERSIANGWQGLFSLEEGRMRGEAKQAQASGKKLSKEQAASIMERLEAESRRRAAINGS